MRRLVAGVAAVGVALAELALVSEAAVAQDPPGRPLPPPVQVAITDAGFVPSVVTTAAGQSVVFTNATDDDQTVTATGGLFDSGMIPAGGAFAVAVPVVGYWPFASSTTPELTGAIAVGRLELEGPADDPVTGHLPVGALPPTDPASYAAEETWGLVARGRRCSCGSDRRRRSAT